MAKTLKELNEEIAAKSQQLHEIFAEAGPDMDLTKVTKIDGDTKQKAAEIKRRNDELAALGQEREPLADMENTRIANDERLKHFSKVANSLPVSGSGQKGGDPDPDRVMKTIEQRIRESDGFKAYQARGLMASVDMPLVELSPTEVKTLVTLTTISPQNVRLPDLVQMALEERTVADLMLESTMDRATLEYYEETTFTNAAATVAEGGTKAESALGYTLRTETARKIAHFIPATDEVLADVPAMEGQIRGRLVFGVRRAEETQLLTGNGVGTNLTGLLNRSGIQTQAKGADPVPDAIYKAMQLVRGAAGSGFAEPTAVVLHPNDWTDIRLLRTADGIYIWGSPADPGPERIWGLPVRQTTAETQNTGLVGAFRPYAQVFRRTGITVQMSTEHSTFFVENKVAILAEERIALAVYRPSAFATVTGI